MTTVSQRQLAAMLSLSVATVSRALHQDPRVHPRTTRRVLALLRKHDYQLDPVVSAGMAKIRRRDFYRETIVWCHDLPRERMMWLKELFTSAEQYGARLGYNIEHVSFDSPRQLARLRSNWRAKGIRGVLLGPMGGPPTTNITFPSWDDFAWVVVGNTFSHPDLHSVGRDYHADIRSAIAWLRERGSHRPGFVLDRTVNAFFKRPLLECAFAHFHETGQLAGRPYHELDMHDSGAFSDWLKTQRPDGIVLPSALGANLRHFDAMIRSLPSALLSPPSRRARKHELYFTARYDVIGQAAVNLLHRLLTNRETGLPGYKQSVLLSSRRSRPTM
jgi:LacI family transcriptional regulator